jgi:glycosyltransferase involved in cell wall biosynthesis
VVITVCVATIPIRAASLSRALTSICGQTLSPAAIIVEYDHEHTGAAATKNRALDRVTTEWVAFLDDDDHFLPQHLEKLSMAQRASGADVVYPMAYVTNQHEGIDPFGRKGAPFDADELRTRSYIPTTALIRTAMFKKVGGFQLPDQTLFPDSVNDDHGGYLAMLDAGAEFHHLPEQTFVWTVTRPGQPGVAGNTSGVGSRW